MQNTEFDELLVAKKSRSGNETVAKWSRNGNACKN